MGKYIVSPLYIRRDFNVFVYFLDDFRSPRFSSLVLSGGAAHSKRLEDLQQLQADGANIMVATPGRLVDLVQKAPLFLGQATNNQTLNPVTRGLRSLEVLILDEADRLLDMGFEPQLVFTLQFSDFCIVAFIVFILSVQIIRYTFIKSLHRHLA